MDKKRETFLLLSFILFYLILASERVISLVFSFKYLDLYGMFVESTFLCYTNIYCIAALLAFGVSSIITIISLTFNGINEDSLRKLCITAGILISSSMVDTAYSHIPIQIMSYGILFMSIFTIMLPILEREDVKSYPILTYIFMACFILAIPKVTETKIINPYLFVAFYIIEIVGSFLLVSSFTAMMVSFFDDRLEITINPCFMFLILFVDTSLIILKWVESFNFLMMISCALSVFVWMFAFIFREEAL